MVKQRNNDFRQWLNRETIKKETTEPPPPLLLHIFVSAVLGSWHLQSLQKRERRSQMFLLCTYMLNPFYFFYKVLYIDVSTICVIFESLIQLNET